MRLVLISDTHNRHLEMAPPPDGDVLIHGGDLTGRGTRQGKGDRVLCQHALAPGRHSPQLGSAPIALGRTTPTMRWR